MEQHLKTIYIMNALVANYEMKHPSMHPRAQSTKYKKGYSDDAV